MDYAVHLVFVSGVAVPPRVDEDGDPKKFFAQQFPKSLIDEFFFLDSSSNGERLLYQRSSVLLEELWKSRRSSKQLPIIFFAHGLGGFLVKQALISATEEPRYRDIATHTSTVLFFGVPHRATRERSWEYLYLRLLSASRSLPDHSLKLVQRLVEELEGINASFRTIFYSFDVANFYESSDHPVLDRSCSILAGTEIPLDCRHDDLWRFIDGGKLAKETCKQILATRNGGHFILRVFLRRLSLLDSQTHRLRPIFSEPRLSLDWECGKESPIYWKSDRQVVGILRISGRPGSGITVTAAKILGALLDRKESQNMVCLSFSFDKNNIRARTPFSLYLSLCRQLLSSRPQLFQHILPVSNFLSKNGVFTADNLWVVACCLMRHLLEYEKIMVYCIIDAVDECIISQAEVTQRLEGFVRLANGRFKLLLSGISLLESSSESSQHQDVVLESGNESMVSSKKQFVQERIRELAFENSAWYGLEDIATGQVDALPPDSPYLLVKLNMLLLEWTSRYCTRKHLKNQLQQQPTTLDGCYKYVMDAIDNTNRKWVTVALRWIVHAVRPLRPTELAVAAALGEIPGGPPWKSQVLDDFGNSIRRDIIGDLKHFMVPLIKVEDNRVHLIHDTFRVFLLDYFAQIARKAKVPTSAPRNDSAQDESESNNEHYEVFFHCLEYLNSFGQQGSAFIMCEDSTGCSHSTNLEFSLLSYASLHWPHHFRKTASKPAAHDYVLQFLRDAGRVKIWTNLYHQLKPPLRSNVIRLDNPHKIVCNFGLIELIDDCINFMKPNEEVYQIHESLDLAAQNGHNNFVQRLLKKGIRSPEALGLAAVGGFGDVVESLLTVGSAINYPDQTGYAPIHHATCGGHKHIVSLLLERSANPNIQISPPSDHESLTFDPELDLRQMKRRMKRSWHRIQRLQVRQRQIRRRRDHGLDSNSDSESDSSSDFGSDSSDSDMDESKSSLLGTEATALSRSLSSGTSLHLAAFTGQIEIVKILLAHHAIDVGKENSSGYNVLKFAAMGGFSELLTLFLHHIKGDKAAESDGNTALHLAVTYGHRKTVEILLKNTSNTSKLIRTKNILGLSPIHIAAREGHLSLLILMLEAEEEKKDTESIASVDKDDQQPLSIASSIADDPFSGHTHLKRPHRRSTIGRSPERKSQLSATLGSLTMDKDYHKSALEWAAEKGHYDVVLFLDKKDRSKSEDRAFALIWAAQNGHTDIVTTLLNGRSVKAATDSRRNTALHLAAKGGHSEILSKLLTQKQGSSRPFLINAKNKGRRTPLHIAAKAGHKDIVGILLTHKAKTGLVDKKSKAALHLAAEKGHLPCVEALLRPENEVDPKAVDDQNRTALHHAAENGHLPVVERLFAFKDIIWMEDSSDSTAFDLVVNRNEVKEVEEFIRILEDTADEGTEFVRGGSPLHVIAQYNNMKILRLLLDKGWKCDAKNANDATPLHIAVENSFSQGVEVLLQIPLCDITARDACDSTVMHFARTKELVNLLLKASAKNDQKDNSGRTPLYLAAYRGNFEVVQALLNSTPRPDVHIKEENSDTLLHAAYDSPSIIKLILEYNVEPNVLNNRGRTPLALAIRWNYIESARVLLGAKADPNLAGNFENSPLYLVFEQEKSLELIQLLADNNADFLAKESDVVSALNIAAQKNKIPEVKYLIQKLGDIETTTTCDIYASVLCDCVMGSDFNPKLAMILLSQSLDVNKTTKSHFTALYAACSDGTADAVKWLLDNNANVNMQGGKYGTALCAAVESEKNAEEKVRLLLERGAHIDFFEENHPTVLQRATAEGNETLISLFLDKGANVNLAGGDLDTPLNEAILSGVSLPTIRRILNNKAETANTRVGGQSPVHVAARSDRVDVLEFIISANPLSEDVNGRPASKMHGSVDNRLCNFDISKTDAMDQTPLIIATIFNSTGIVDTLLKSKFRTPEMLNARDYEGKTALAHAVSLDNLELVKELLKSDADPRIVDCRNRSSLYWAARAAGTETLEIIIAALEKCEGNTIQLWNLAIHGAITSNKRQALEKLLEKEEVNAEYVGPDGWSPLYTAKEYEFYRMESILPERAGDISLLTDGLKIPSSWHLNDRFPALKLESNGITVGTIGAAKFIYLGRRGEGHGAVRADYPMLPLIQDKIYYFEIKITKAIEKDELAVGFCDDKAPLESMLGWNSGSWGFHSDDGRVYEGGKRWNGYAYNNLYAAGDVIGCGVNFAENSAFYTKNGEVIGCAFTDIRGKLYPAISMDITQKGLEISAVFPGKDGKSADFMFQGDLEGEKTLDLITSQ